MLKNTPTFITNLKSVNPKSSKSYPLVSICIAAYNASLYIADAIDSLLSQSHHQIEIIVVNDGSTDETESILASFTDPRIKVYSIANIGQAAALNLAFSYASGDYVKFMDADDLISADFIALQLAQVMDYTDAIATAEWGRFYNDDLSTFKKSPESVWRHLKPIDWLIESLENGANMMQCALFLIPRNVLMRSGLWKAELTLANDIDFGIRLLLQASQVRFCPGAILYYRSGMPSLSAQKSEKAYRSAFKSISSGVEALLSFENSKRSRRVAANIYQLWAYEFYPAAPDLYLKAIQKVNELGGSALPYPAGGITKLLSQFLGWKLIKRIKNYL